VPSTIDALAVLVVALLPGALYTWSFERMVGRWGIGFSDRLLRFIGISTVLHALVAPVTYTLWRDYLREDAQPGINALPLWMWGVAILYVGVPSALGALVAHGFREDWKGLRALMGSSPAPTAWDAIFAGNPAGWVLMRMKSGRWIGGEYAAGSYAGGYPEPADLFLSKEFHVDQEVGDFVPGQDGQPLPVGYGVLVRWDDVEYLQVTPTETT
jgi:uncharacterized protein DUF6338